MGIMHSDQMDDYTWRIDVRYVPESVRGWMSSGRDLPTFYVYGVSTPELALKEAREITGDRWPTTRYDIVNQHGNIVLSHTEEK